MAGQATKLSDCFCPLHFLSKVQVHYCDNTLSVRPSLTFYILNFSLKPMNGIQRNLTGSKMSTFSTKFVFFGPIGKTRWSPGLWFAEIFSTSPLQTLNGIDRKQDLNVIYEVYVFRSDWKNKMAAPACDWLKHFRLLLWHRRTEFNETW